jgi:hypothetical protein
MEERHSLDGTTAFASHIDKVGFLFSISSSKFVWRFNFDSNSASVLAHFAIPSIISNLKRDF